MHMNRYFVLKNKSVLLSPFQLVDFVTVFINPYTMAYAFFDLLRHTTLIYTFLLSIVAFVYLHVYFVLLIFIFNHRYLQNYLYDYSF